MPDGKPAAPAPAAPPPSDKPAAPPPSDKPAAPPPSDKPAAPPPSDKPAAPADKPAAAAPGDKPAEPAAPTPAQLEEAKKAYLDGAALYEKGERAAAVEKFKESYRLSRNPVLLYNIALTFDELKDLEKALFYYEKFLKDAPKTAVQRGDATKRLKSLRKELEALGKVSDETDKPAGGDATAGGTAAGGTAAGGTAAGGTTGDAGAAAGGTTGDAGAAAGGATGDTGAAAGGTTGDAGAGTVSAGSGKKYDAFMHKVVEDAPPAKPLDITAFVPEDSGWQVTLYFRSAGEMKFTSTNMRPRYNELVGRIPGRKMKGVSVQYYIEVRDRAGATIARSGKATSPNLVFLDDRAKPFYYPDFIDENEGEAGAGTDDLGEGPAPLLVPATPGTGFMDVGSSKFRYAKWGTTALAGTSLALTVVFYLSASNANSELEAQAESSVNDTCPTGPPCRSYGNAQKDIADYGNRYETLTNVALVAGILTSGIAGYYWYKEIKAGKPESSAPTRRAGTALRETVVVPVVTGDFVGGAAALRF